MTEAKRKSPLKCTTKQRIEIYEHLKTVIIQTDEKGVVRYPDGTTDETVAADFNVSPVSVRAIRTEMFGDIKRRRIVHVDPTPRIEALEATVTNHAKILHDFELRWNKLLDNLQLNHVIDCKHLKIGH